MSSHHKNVERLQEIGERCAPICELDDVLHDQVVARGSEHGDAAMKAVEESWPNVAPPQKWPVGVSSGGQSDGEHVGGHVQEGLVQHLL
jgi:hypothetical protein